MAAIFLSYVRDDEARASRLAELLEAAGHKVWWDRHIKGGTQYSAAIEEALKSADKVVVLWSAQSVQSAWVRDEAVEGRDSGRLVPVRLDRSAPPLGFRQFQTVDLSGWRGTGTPAALAELEDAISDTSEVRPKPKSARTFEWKPAWIVALLGMLAIGIAGYLMLRPAGAEAVTVLVEPASEDAVAKAAARDLVVKLGTIDAGNVSGFRLTSDQATAKDASFVLQVAGEDGAETSSRELTLFTAKDRSILWASHFEQPKAASADLSAQLETAAALVLKCALETTGARPRLPADVAKLYLTGCSKLEDQFDETATNVTPYFEQVVSRAPKFAPAWDNLLESQAWKAFFEADSPLLPQIRKNLERARKLGIDVPGMYFAGSSLQRPKSFAGTIDALKEGLKKFPEDASLHSTLASALMAVGRQNDAVQEARIATELDPISPATFGNYIFILAHSGRFEQANRELKRAEKLWPGTTALRQARFFIDLRYGDPKAALAMIQDGNLKWGQGPTEAFLKARIDPTPANIEQAIAAAETFRRQQPLFIAVPVQTLGQFGRTEEALQVFLNYGTPAYTVFSSETFFRPALHEVRRDPRFMKAMAQMGLAQYWKKSGKWPDFCFDADLPYDCRKEADKYL